MTAALQAVLALIQQILPLLGGPIPLVGVILKALTTWLPLIQMEIATVYEPVKQIIAALHNSEITQAQKIELKALDAKLDAAFEEAVAGLDPDAGDP